MRLLTGGPDASAGPRAASSWWTRRRSAGTTRSLRTIPSIVGDYRASAHVDVEHDRGDLEAGARLRMPVTVLQQDWGPELSSGGAAMWGAWATDLDHRTVSSGHFMAEEAPAEVIKALRDLLAR